MLMSTKLAMLYNTKFLTGSIKNGAPEVTCPLKSVHMHKPIGLGHSDKMPWLSLEITVQICPNILVLYADPA
jgi:hypothetical protein